MNIPAKYPHPFFLGQVLGIRIERTIVWNQYIQRIIPFAFPACFSSCYYSNRITLHAKISLQDLVSQYNKQNFSKCWRDLPFGTCLLFKNTALKIHHIHSLSSVSLHQCNFQAGHAGKPLSQWSQKLLKGTLCPSDVRLQTSQVFACIRITYTWNNSTNRKKKRVKSI